MIDLVASSARNNLEHVDEFGALDRVAADAHRRGLAEADLGRLEHGFIGQRARTRDDADIALLEDIAGHDADLAFVGGHDAGQFGPIRRDFEPASARLTLIMSSTGMPSVMQTISGISASMASQIASAAPGGGT